MVGIVLTSGDPPTTDKITKLINELRDLYSITDEEAKELQRHFEFIHDVSMNIASILPSDDFKPWLDALLPKIDFYYWNRYRKYLGQKGLSHQVLAAIDDTTQRILEQLENPSKGRPWQRRGMVVGHVQSGKTSNYTGLICRAADVGYKVIIVIAGIHNNLRNQTQLRIDEGFIGINSTKKLSNSTKGSKYVGVGRFDSTRQPSSFTNSISDFNKTLAQTIGIPLDNLKEPVVFVIKKNSSTLKNLLEWLTDNNARRGAKQIDYPMLLIDDEADNASINISKGIDEVSKINGQIRALLQTFTRSCYVGYTATPFANIFIDPESDNEMYGEDLFPKHFIVGLDPPSNYFGPQKVFSNFETSRFIKFIHDSDASIPMNHKIDFDVNELPESLKLAIRVFVIAIAIRATRGQNSVHNSMLVNVSRFVSVQNQIRNEIHEFLENIRNSVRVNGMKAEYETFLDPEIASLHDAFANEYANNCACTWKQISTHLYDTIVKIRIVEVNSRSHGSLNYVDNDDGLSVIAVGGFSLSRGLTLEGLSVSYFLRRSIMYDTLMQMGRWFGYRNQYEDLCRIWITEESASWYSHISESIEELLEELKVMERVGASPKDFGLKVRSHPSTLIVTARNKMGSGKTHVAQLGLSEKFIETHTLSSVYDDLENNRRAVVSLMDTLKDLNKFPLPRLAADNSPLLSHFVNDVPVNAVHDFLRRFRNHSDSLLTETEPVVTFIERHSADRLSQWDIYFPSVEKIDGRKNSVLVDNSILGFQVACQRRTKGKNSIPDKKLLIGNNRKVSAERIEKIGLDNEQIDTANTDWHEIGRSADLKSECPDRFFRRVRRNPLLIIHLLAITDKDSRELEYDKPVIAWSISFPRIENQKRVEYVVNTTWSKQQYSYEDEEESKGDE